MTSRSERRRVQESSDDSSEDEVTLTHIQCWIPSQGIDLVCLATYLKEFIDDTATIRPSANPQNRDKQGYTIGARNTLSVAGCRDIIEDSRYWEKEKQSKEYRRDPYSFAESDTWDHRKKNGASPGHTNPRRRRRTAAETTTATSAARTNETTTKPSIDRHGRDPRPEPPPRPSNPPPDVLASKIPSAGLDTSMRKMSIADQDTPQIGRVKRFLTSDETREESNRGVRVAPNTSSTRHRDKTEDDVRSTITTTTTAAARAQRDRHAVDEDDVRSTSSTNRRDRHGR